MSKKYFLPEYTINLLNEMNWSQAELARRAKVSGTAISDMLSRKAKGGYKLALAIAEATKRPPEEALQAAGLLDVPQSQDEKSEEINYIANLLKEEYKENLLSYARYQLQQQEGKGDEYRSSNRPSSSPS